MKTLEEIKQNPRPFVVGEEFYDMQTGETYTCETVHGAYLYSNGEPFQASDCLHIQDAIDCGLVDGWRRPDNVPNEEGDYLAVTKFNGKLCKSMIRWNGRIWVNKFEVLAWRDLPPLPEWVK